MAENIVKIKLQADTTGIDVIKNKLSDLATSAKRSGEVQESSLEKLGILQTAQNAAKKENIALTDQANNLLNEQRKQFESVASSVANIKLKEVFNKQILKDFSNEITPLQNKIQEISKIFALTPARQGKVSRSKEPSDFVKDLYSVQQENFKVPDYGNIAVAQAIYARQRIQDEENLAKEVRDRELTALRKYIEEVNTITSGRATEKQSKDFALVEAAMKKHNDNMLTARREYIKSLENIDEGWKQQLLDNERIEKEIRQKELNALKEDIIERSRLEEEKARIRIGSATEKQAKDEAVVNAAIDRIAKRKEESARNLARQEEYLIEQWENKYNDAISRINNKNITLANKPKIYQTTAAQSASVFEEAGIIPAAKMDMSKLSSYKSGTMDMARMAQFGNITNNLLKNQEQLARANEKVAKSNGILNKSLAEIIIQYRAINFVYNQFLNTLYDIPKVFIQLESTRASLTATFGSMTAANRELSFLTQESLRTGVAVGVLREQYSSAAASFISAGQSVENTRKIFQNMNVVATTLHLTGDQVKSTYLALSQMFNKGKVQAEELTKQLSQVIPAVTNQQAKALGITVSELYDRMKKGALSADEAVLKLSETLATQYGGEAFRKASEGLNAQLGRLQTAWTLYIETLGTATEGMMKTAVIVATDLVNALTTFEKTTSLNSGKLSIFASILAGLAAGAVASAISGFFSLTGVVGGFQAALLLATNQLKALYALLLANPGTALVAVFAAIGTKLYFMADAAKSAEENLQRVIKAEKLRRGELALSNSEIIKDKLKDNEDFLAAQQAVVTAQERYNRVSKTAGNTEFDKKIVSESLTNLNYALSAQQSIIDEFAAKQEAAAAKKYELSSVELAQDKRMREENLRNRKEFAKLVDSQYAEEEENLKTRLEKGEATAKEQLEILQQNKKEALKKLEEQDSKKAGPAANQAFKTQMNELKLDAKEQVAVISDLLNTLEEDYSYNLISIKSYYDQKRNLQQAAFNVEKQTLEEEIKLAEGKKDFAKVAELKRKAVELEIKFGKENVQTIKDEIAAQRELQKLKGQTALEVYAFSGKGAASFQDLWGEEWATSAGKIAAFMENNQEAAAKNEEALIKHKALMAATEQHTQRIANLQQQYNLSLEQANLDYKLGELDRVELSDKLAEAGAIRIESLYKEIEAMQKLKEYSQDDLTAQNKINSALQERLKILADIADKEAKYRESDIAKVIPGYSNLDSYKQRLEDNKIAYSTRLADISGQMGSEKASISTIKSDVATAAGNYTGNDPAQIKMYETLGNLQNTEFEGYQALIDQKSAADKKYTASNMAAYAGMFSSIASIGADTFMGLTQQAQKMYGAQSKEAQKAFKMYKAMRIAETLMSGAQAVISALATPPIYVGIALAAVAAAMTAFQVSQISSQQMPQAHAGLDYVPENNQTYLLSKGERVLAPQQNKDLTGYLKERKMGETSGSNQPVQNNVRIINSVDPSVFHEYLGTSEGEQVIINVVRRNREALA